MKSFMASLCFSFARSGGSSSGLLNTARNSLQIPQAFLRIQ